MEKRDSVIKAGPIAEILNTQEEVLFGYVFGSAITGGHRPGSDVDIAVYLDPERRSGWFNIRLELLEKLTRALRKEADVVVLNTAAPFLRYVALREGALVFERSPSARIDFELKALNEYFDYQPILEQYQARLRASV